MPIRVAAPSTASDLGLEAVILDVGLLPLCPMRSKSVFRPYEVTPSPLPLGATPRIPAISGGPEGERAGSV